MEFFPVCKKAFYFQRHYIPTIKEYHDISITHADGQRFFSFWEQLSTLTHTIEVNLFLMWADNVKLEYPGKIQIQDQPEFFQNLQSFVECSMKMSIRYNFFIDLDSIHNKLSSDYSLNVCFSCHFQSFS